MKNKKVKRAVTALCVVAAIVAALFVGLHLWLRPNTKITRSLASSAEVKVSAPFSYCGYSATTYHAYTKQSVYVPMDDGVKLAVDVYLPANDEGSAKAFPAVFQYTPYGRAYAVPGKRSLIDKIKMKIGVKSADSILDRADSHDTVYGSTDEIVQTLLSCGYA